MLNVKIAIDAIDYEKTLSNLYPMLMDVLNRQESGNMGIWIFRKIGRASEDAVLSLMRRLNNDEKTALIAYLFRANKEMILGKIRGFLQKSKYSNCFSFRDISVEEISDGVNIYLYDVDVNYKEMLLVFPEMNSSGSSFGIKTAKAFSAFAPNRIFGSMGDYAALQLLRNSSIANRIVGLIQNVLRNNGIYANVADIEIARADDPAAAIPEMNAYGAAMPQQLSDKLVDTVSEFILDLLNAHQQADLQAER